MSAARYTVLQTVLRTGTVVAQLPVTGISFTETLNAAGAAQVGIPLSCPQADPTSLYAGGSGLVVTRDDEPVWGGILWNLAADLAAGTLTLGASGYHSHYKGRNLADGFAVVDWDIADILKAWLNRPNAVGTDLSAVMPTGRKRTRQWTKYELKNVADSVEELADNIGGYNFRYESYWIDRGKTLGNRFLISDRSGSPNPHVLTHRENCNVTSVTYDSTALATTAYAVGADNGAGEKLVGISSNTDLGTRIPTKNIVTTYSDVKETQTLILKAQATVNAGMAPVAIPSLTLYPDMFRPQDFVPGDACTVSADSGYVALSHDFVVTERKTDVDTNGRETIALSLANKELFSNANPS
ncbi:hypothetical protein GCM10010193_09100 [Kitasatospora atroaurantiaca]|uniref:Uncharacterized protein n=1 Tax=Kitasatospora atroaurantiaca TaxID=285545 RepID=A0A561ERX0_9ACTN|nr:hypothetical protein [Kitasatospora atroaurantiaca]TWE18362.1 hypothetical protein FB465_3429 [Kitasatospora atroaurantiaca]